MTEHSNALKSVRNEYQRFQIFQEHKTFIQPVSCRVGYRDEIQKKGEVNKKIKVLLIAQFIPLRSVLQQFFQLPEVLEETFNYINDIDSSKEVICNLVQSKLWDKIKTDDQTSLTLPLVLFFDDYECNNPLGTRKVVVKCGAVYVSLPCLPPEMQSKLENIFLFVLFNTLDKKMIKNDVVFSRMKEELHFLRNEGIDVQYGLRKMKLRFLLALIVGDNLGLNSILGFQGNFNSKAF